MWPLIPNWHSALSWLALALAAQSCTGQVPDNTRVGAAAITETSALKISPAAVTLVVDGSTAVTASLTDVGQIDIDVTDQVQWTVDDQQDLVKFDPDFAGRLTAYKVGTSSVSATLRELKVTVPVQVVATADSLVRIEIVPAEATLAQSEVLELGLKAVFGNGTDEDVTAKAKWTLEEGEKYFAFDDKLATLTGKNLAPNESGGQGIVSASYRELSTKLIAKLSSEDSEAAAPRVTSIVRAESQAAATNATALSFDVSFSKEVSGVDAADFAGSPVGITVSSVVPKSSSGRDYTVVLSASGLGSNQQTAVGLELINDGSIIAKNQLPLSSGAVSTESVLFDNRSPTLTSIARASPATTVAATSQVEFLATFSEDVIGVEANDFVGVSGTVTGMQVTAVTSTSSAVYRIVVETGSGNGSLGLSLASNSSVVDAAGNTLTNLTIDGTNESYTMNHPTPSLTIGPPSVSTVSSLSTVVDFTLTLVDALVVTLSNQDVSLVTTGGASCSQKSVSGTGLTSRVVSLSNCTGSGTVAIQIAAGALSNGGILSLASTTSASFTVVPANTAPTISDISDKSTDEDTATSAIAITVGDAESAAASLTMSGSSSNTNLVPNGNIVFGGSGSSRTVTITPAANLSGTSTITVSVNDGTDTTSDTFVLTVGAVNDAPTISDVTDKTTAEDTATSAIAMTVGDAETAAASLTLTASSSNQTIVPDGNIVLGGSGASRTATITPAANQSGSVTITLSVSDGNLSSSDTFDLTVGAANDAPTISDVADLSTDEDTATSAIAITVGDAETAAASLTMSGSSSNPSLIPNGNIVFGGSGSSRTVTITPTANLSGTATITVSVNDGTDTTSDTFVLTVNAVNDVPTITDVTNKSTAEDTATSAIAFTIGDDVTAAASLTVTATSSNQTIVPNGNIVLGGSGASRTATITPAANQNGSVTITLSVSDGSLSTNDTFDLTVSAVNDAPVIAAIEDVSISEDSSTGAINFTVSDVETAAGSLILSASSSNPSVIPNGSVVFGGTGGSRTVTATPSTNANGTATITVTLSDGAASVTEDFTVTVAAVNDAPTISDVPNQNASGGVATSGIAVTVDDAETAAASLTLTAASNNQTVIPNANIVLGGTGANRTATITPASGQSGTVTVTLTISDGSLQATDSFSVVVSDPVATPTFSVAAGTYNSTRSVTISTTTGGSTIYYTLDGSTPTTSSSVYSSAVSVVETSTLKAIATKSGQANSAVASADYRITNVSILLHCDGSNNGTTITDSSTNNLSPTNTAVITSTAQSKFGGSSCYFNGTSAFLRYGYSSIVDLGGSNWTIEAWIRLSAFDGAMVSKDTHGTNFDWNVTPSTSTQAHIYTYGTQDYYVANVSAMSLNTWHHIALVRSGGTLRYYVDGVGSTDISTMGISNDSQSYWTVGAYSWNNPGSFFSGYMDEVRITNGLARYTANFTPPTAAFVNP